ncbi:ATP-binding protein [Planctopirus ephydatiae]|nr:ATP-binding protein [Planctopirus ephydatiae]
MDVLTTGLCQVLEDAGCPLAVDVHHRLQFETLLTELSSKFVNVPASQVDSQIEWGLRRIVELLGIDRSGLGQVSEDRRQLVVTHSYQLPGIPPSAFIMLDSQFPTFARMVHQGLVVRLPDDMPPEATQEREYFRQVGMKSNVTIPLMAMGIVVGGIGFSSFRSQLRLPDEFIPRLRLVGDIFTNALARKRADEALCAKEQSLRQAKDGLRLLATKLLNSQEEERRRIAREMHDDWTQRLAILGIESAKLEGCLDTQAVALPILHNIRTQLVSLSEDVHDLSRQLHPAILNDLGLVEALRSECACFSRREEITVDYVADDVPENMSKEVALCVYRVAQEALRNVAKHAAVNRTAVNLAVINQELMLRVQDHGVGFDPDSGRILAGVGLSSMEERVRMVDGEFSIYSEPGHGTTIEVRVPLSGSPA